MPEQNNHADFRWSSEQIEKFRQVLPRYELYAQTLRRVLEQAARHYAPLAIVQTRPKAIPSFAEKIQRKKLKYRDPVNQLTDLCGGRVITQTQSEVKAVCDFIEKNFDVDWDNSIDVRQRLKATEFGYRSIHYVVQFKPGVFPSKEIDVAIPEDVMGLKAEIQVRTILEHAWAVFAHDRAYKSAFTIPTKWQRELAGLAAMLEEADDAVSRIQAGLQTYATSYGAYMDEDQMRQEIALLETVLQCSPGNNEVAYRIGKLWMALGKWDQTVAVLARYADSGYQPILRDLGVALCKLHHDKPKSKEYREGQKYLENASAPPNKDADALASLAGTWKTLDERRARELYRQGFEVDPSDPYAVSNYLVYEIAYRRDISPVALMSTAIYAAMQRCRDQADVGINLPWAFYNLGLFHLLLGQPYDSLAAYAKAISLSTTDWMIITSTRSLEQLAGVEDKFVGFDWARKLLLIGRAVKFPSDETREQVKQLATPDKPIAAPVAIVAGGCDADFEPQIPSYRQLLVEAFSGFVGTIISGGTIAGISGLVGDVQHAYPKQIQTMGYIPKLIPADTSIDSRYKQTRITEGTNFSALEPLQYWMDLIAAGIAPTQVKLLGISGGAISGAEYRIALALGARVGVIEGSGREAANLVQDDGWGTSKLLLRLPADAMTLRAFIGSGIPKLKAPTRETVAKMIHENYREDQKHQPSDPSLVDWDALADNLKDSNLQQADHIQEKLRQIGCSLHKVQGQKIALMKFSDKEIEVLAEMEHGRWVVERLGDGWKWSETRDVAKKTSPYLVPWSQLPDNVKEWDRATVRKISEHLAKVGFEIRRTRQRSE